MTGRARVLLVLLVVAAGLLVVGIVLGQAGAAQFREFIQWGIHPDHSCAPYPGHPGSSAEPAWEAVACCAAGAILAAFGFLTDRRQFPLTCTTALTVTCLLATYETWTLARAISGCAVYLS